MGVHCSRNNSRSAARGKLCLEEKEYIRYLRIKNLLLLDPLFLKTFEDFKPALSSIYLIWEIAEKIEKNTHNVGLSFSERTKFETLQRPLTYFSIKYYVGSLFWGRMERGILVPTQAPYRHSSNILLGIHGTRPIVSSLCFRTT